MEAQNLQRRFVAASKPSGRDSLGHRCGVRWNAAWRPSGRHGRRQLQDAVAVISLPFAGVHAFGQAEYSFEGSAGDFLVMKIHVLFAALRLALTGRDRSPRARSSGIPGSPPGCDTRQWYLPFSSNGRDRRQRLRGSCGWRRFIKQPATRDAAKNLVKVPAVIEPVLKQVLHHIPLIHQRQCGGAGPHIV